MTIRRPGGLGRNEERAAIDPDWSPRWPVDWQRHYAASRLLLAEEHGPTEILPGVTVHGIDVGAWIHRQREPSVWQALMPEQRERLERLGPHPPRSKWSGRDGGSVSACPYTGCTALGRERTPGWLEWPP
ncbi:helicase associated domain-containing protein [Streptomyces sp. SID14515]|uniref:helicase associated domain-containing protein n=1 Tax=Streptomyces sp. SID14515 TaxID=2706074 RepID=UPI0031BA137B